MEVYLFCIAFSVKQSYKDLNVPAEQQKTYAEVVERGPPPEPTVPIMAGYVETKI